MDYPPTNPEHYGAKPPRPPERDKRRELIARTRSKEPNYEEDFRWVYRNLQVGDKGKDIEPELMPDMDDCPSMSAWNLFKHLSTNEEARNKFFQEAASKLIGQAVKEKPQVDEDQENERRMWRNCSETFDLLEKFVPPGSVTCPHCGEDYRFPKKGA